MQGRFSQGTSSALPCQLALTSSQVIEHKFARINYVSLQDNSDGIDIIRVTPEWRKKNPRYDFVLINLDYQTLSCAQVHILFTIESPGGKIQVALIRILKSLA
jgi:hypothetical protein